MINIKSNEAKAKFSEILRRVEAGECYSAFVEAVAAMKAFKKVKKPEGMSIKAMIQKDRR